MELGNYDGELHWGMDEGGDEDQDIADTGDGIQESCTIFIITQVSGLNEWWEWNGDETSVVKFKKHTGANVVKF